MKLKEFLSLVKGFDEDSEIKIVSQDGLEDLEYVDTGTVDEDTWIILKVKERK